MDPLNELSITGWFLMLKDGDEEAARQLWERLGPRIINAAGHKLGNAPKLAADEEDIAQNVFISLVRGATAGRFDRIQDREQLWVLLLTIINRKVVDYLRREMAKKRGGRNRVTECDLNARHPETEGVTLESLAEHMSTPEVVAIFEEESNRLLTILCDDRLQTIASMRIQGYRIREIAQELNLTTRTIERKLDNIRTVWAKELSREEETQSYQSVAGGIQRRN